MSLAAHLGDMSKGKEQAQQGKRERKEVLEAGWGEEENWAAVSSTRIDPFRAGLIFLFFYWVGSFHYLSHLSFI